MISDETRPATQTQMATHRFETNAEVDVLVFEGEYGDACEICGASPTAVYVEVRRADLDASQKTGAGVAKETVERRYFCAQHVCAADMVYRSY